MKILAIETSCDETAASVIDAQGNIRAPSFIIDSHAVHSQIEQHRPYGGVFPNLAKREHAAHIIEVLQRVIPSLDKKPLLLSGEQTETITQLLDREGDLAMHLIKYLQSIPAPNIDAICVTAGPGLEPALWVGIRTAQALGAAWNIPV